MDKVAVFLDYENVHRTGHHLYAAFGEPVYSTVVDPIQIAERLARKRNRESMVNEIQIFRGRPVPEHQPTPASQNDIQAARWESDARVTLHRRDLKYEFYEDGTFSAREKGVDVALAVALVEGAMLGRFDAAIVFSSDTDLVPAVELAYHRTSAHIELACWTGGKPIWFPEGLRSVPKRFAPYCHFLKEHDFLDAREPSLDA